MHHLARFVFISLAMLFSLSAGAEPVVNRYYQDYEVTGHDIQALRYAISTRGPQAADGMRYAAHTNYDIHWNYNFASLTDGRCAVNAVQVTANINYRMPRLAQSSLMPERVNRQWQLYYRALHQHEEGHAQLGINAAHDIEHMLPTLAAQNDCGTMAGVANRAATEIIQHYHIKNLEYDRHTEHGHRQGAVLASLQ